MSSYDEHLISQAGGDGDVLDLDAIQAQAEINKYLGKTASQDEAKNTLALLALVREQAAKLDAVRALTQAAWDGESYVLPGGYPSRPVEAFDLRAALEPTP